MVNILFDFAAQVQEKMVEARQAAERMQESSRKLTGVAFAKDVNLSDLSIPETFSVEPAQKVPKDYTPQSKKVGRNLAGFKTPASAIDLESSPGSGDGPIIPPTGERERNLREIFNQMQEKEKEPEVV